MTNDEFGATVLSLVICHLSFVICHLSLVNYLGKLPNNFLRLR